MKTYHYSQNLLDGNIIVTRFVTCCLKRDELVMIYQNLSKVNYTNVELERVRSELLAEIERVPNLL